MRNSKRKKEEQITPWKLSEVSSTQQIENRIPRQRKEERDN